ncbi:MAG: TIGR01777 family oxidoreductase [Deltaproteobacteria bacterium]|nr:TIGR01777 family oxidoreductase [Deltaproteobacteria bacterium]
MRVLVAGGSGFVGAHLVRSLIARGDTVTVLTRDIDAARKELPRECRVAHWEPGKRGPWFEELPFVDAVVNLAGAPVAQRWTDASKRIIKESRVAATTSIVEAIEAAGESRARKAKRPAVLVNASAIGFYGTPTSGEVDESGEAGSDFLAGVCKAWEDAAVPAEKLGVRVVRLRIGVVLGKGGGAMARMVGPMGAFVAGPIGKGDNTVSWVHLEDVVGMITWALDDASVTGAVNCTSPFPTTGKGLAKAMASVLGKPAFAAPEAFVRPVLGDMIELVIGSQTVFPRRAVDLGYEFHFARLVPGLEQALHED